MPKKKNKVSGAVLKFFQRVGAKGGKARAQKHGHEQLSTWAKRGGRPIGTRHLRPKDKVISALEKRQKGRSIADFATEIGCSYGSLYAVMNGLSPAGPKILSYLGMEVKNDAAPKPKAKAKNRQQVARRQMPPTALSA